jgi:hypothetical protein
MAAMSLSEASLPEPLKGELQCHPVLAETDGWFTEGFETEDLQEAKALLEELR